MDRERFEQIRDAFARSARPIEVPPVAAPRPRSVKLSVITGVQAYGVHMAIVKPEDEAPYSSVHKSLCGIGNNYLLGWYWKKTTDDSADCAECVGKADELYAEGAELFDPATYQPRLWCTGPPIPIYDFCPIDTHDGMLDLPTVTAGGDEEEEDASDA